MVSRRALAHDSATGMLEIGHENVTVKTKVAGAKTKMTDRGIATEKGDAETRVTAGIETEGIEEGEAAAETGERKRKKDPN